MYRTHTEKELTVKQRNFLREFPKDFNATQAAIRAGYSAKTANAAGSRLVDSIDRFLQEIERLAYFDPRKLFDEHGNPIEIPKLGDEEAASIAGFKFYEDFEGKGEARKAVGYTREFKLADRISALSLLGKVHGFYHEKGNGMHSPLEQAATALLLEMKAVIEQRQRERQWCEGNDRPL